MEPAKANYYKVQASEPIEGQSYWRTFLVRVVARDIEDAIAVVKGEHPTCHIYTIGHHGRVEFITGKVRDALV
jgi:hypothetical protein